MRHLMSPLDFSTEELEELMDLADDIRLHPENSRMQDIYVEECYIQGVAQHVIKAL